MDYSKLRGKIVEVFGSVRAFAKELDDDETYIYKILNTGKPLSAKALLKWVKALGISGKDIGVYFFTPKVEKTQQ